MPGSRKETDSPRAITAWRLRLLKKTLQEEGVIAYPTEGVWGLGCLPQSRNAVEKILRLKNRPWEKGLILVAANMAQIATWLEDLTVEQIRALEASWPGPVTWILPDKKRSPEWVRGRHETLAIRVSAHPIVQDLCHCVGGPLVSTSANPSTHQPARTLFQVRRYFGNAIDAYCPGNLGDASGPSEIRDIMTLSVVRPKESAR